MSKFEYDDIMQIVSTHCGIDIQSVETETFQYVNSAIVQMLSAARVWPNPGEIERQLEDARHKLNEAITAVQGLDDFAKALARKEADRDRDEEWERLLIEKCRADLPESEKERLEDILRDWKPQPKELWADYAAISAMGKLRDALIFPIEQAIPDVQLGPGRPRNRRAYLVADIAYRMFNYLTGEKPTFWNGGETPFSRMVADLYRAYGIKSTIRKPIEAAMHKYKNQT